MKQYKIAVYPGDGIGPEVVAEARRKGDERFRPLAPNADT